MNKAPAAFCKFSLMKYTQFYSINANPVKFVFVWVPLTRDKVVKVQEPLPNRLNKKSNKLIVRVYFHIFSHPGHVQRVYNSFLFRIFTLYMPESGFAPPIIMLVNV